MPLTITITYLEGDPEPFDESIRYLIASNWDATKANDVTPAFLSPHGYGTNEADIDNPISNTDIKIKKVGGLIMMESLNNLHNANWSSASKNRTGKLTEIQFTIYARTKWEAFLFQEEINRIIAVNRPNTAVRISKSSGAEDSAIASFEEGEISFTDPEFVDSQKGQVLMSQGVLGVQWQKTMQ